MKTMHEGAISAAAAALVLGPGGCSGMSTQDRDTAIGAGVGAVGGAALTGGSAVGTTSRPCTAGALIA